MAVEIERKYLVDHHKILPLLHNGQLIKQGYIPTTNNTTVRVRIKQHTAYLTIKGASKGIARTEFEYTIPRDEAENMLSNFCAPNLIVKMRYELIHQQLTWEIDVFDGANKGLIIAEIELDSHDQHFERPDWAIKEVSEDQRYYNINLLQYPYSRW